MVSLRNMAAIPFDIGRSNSLVFVHFTYLHYLFVAAHHHFCAVPVMMQYMLWPSVHQSWYCVKMVDLSSKRHCWMV